MTNLSESQKIYLKKKELTVNDNKLCKNRLKELFNYNGKSNPNINVLTNFAIKQIKKKTSYSYLWVEFLSIFKPNFIKTSKVKTGIWYLQQEKCPYITLPCNKNTENAIEAEVNFYTWIGPSKLSQVVGQNIFSANIHSACLRLIHNSDIFKIKAEHCWFNACNNSRMRNDICFFNRDNQVILVIEYHEANGPHSTPNGTFLDQCKKYLCQLADKPYFEKKEESNESFGQWFAPMYQALFQKLTGSEPSLHNLYVVNKIRKILKEFISSSQILFLYKEIVKQELGNNRKPDIPLKIFLTEFFSIDEDLFIEYKNHILEELKEAEHLSNEFVVIDKKVLITYDLFMKITFILGEINNEFNNYLFTFEKLSRACLLLIRQELKENEIKREYNLAYLQRIWEWGFIKGENSSLFSDSHKMIDILCQVLQSIRKKTHDNNKAKLLSIISNFLQPANRKFSLINQEQLQKN